MTARAEVSKTNKYWISKHRYYELKYFCLQYPEWRRKYSDMKYIGSSTYEDINVKNNRPSDLTYKSAEQRILYFNKMLMIEKSAKEAEAELDAYILKGVTEGYSYLKLRTLFNIPCSRDMYYDRYRKFFWLLDKIKDWYLEEFNMEDKLFKGLLVVASGVVAFKAIKAVRYYKLQKELFEEVEESATDEKWFAAKTSPLMKGVIFYGRIKKNQC